MLKETGKIGWIMENRNQLLEQAPISKLIWKMTIPSVIGVMAYNLYNIFDTLFISLGVGMDAVGGVAIAFPLLVFVSAVSSTCLLYRSPSPRDS